MKMERRRVALVVTGMAAVLVVVVFASMGLSSSHRLGTQASPKPEVSQRASGPAGALRLSREHGPLILGAPVTLAKAESLAGVHLPRPKTALASDSSIRGVFYEEERFDDGRPPSYQIAIDYDVGIIVYFHPVADDGKIFDDPSKEYATLADSVNAGTRNAIASVTTIQGVPALVIQRSATGVSSVDLVLPSGLRIQLIAEYAPDMDVTTVEAIAQGITG